MLPKTIPLPTKERVTVNAYAAAFHSVRDRFIAGVGEPYDKELVTAWHACGVINPEIRDLILETGADNRGRVLHEKIVMHLTLKPSSFDTVLSAMKGDWSSNLSDSMKELVSQIQTNLRQEDSIQRNLTRLVNNFIIPGREQSSKSAQDQLMEHAFEIVTVPENKGYRAENKEAGELFSELHDCIHTNAASGQQWKLQQDLGNLVNKKTLLTGFAGGGKTHFTAQVLARFLSNTIGSSQNAQPLSVVYLECRKLNQLQNTRAETTGTLESLLEQIGVNFPYDIKRGEEIGMILFIIDGFDELACKDQLSPDIG